MSDRNPWGIPERQARALDCLVLAGTPEVGAEMFGGSYREFIGLTQRALDHIPLVARMHKLMAWRDHRGLIVPWPDATVVRFGVTDQHAEVLDLWCAGKSTREIAAVLGITGQAVFGRLRTAKAKLPGERDGQKQAAWRRECSQ